ncbi:MAG: group II intron reverse transcriptase/maturase [Acidobacteria bacterium]|nr:group II intron reverse transcriptase/maturase [Acidobacteriota bacterium]
MGASSITAGEEVTGPGTMQLMEAVVERGNMLAALHRVERNKGAAGVDGMTVADLRANLKEQWPTVRESLLAGNYAPKPVLRVEIPKPDGKGVRKLGIPTVMDRLIQQALHQVMQPIFDPGFSGSSYGFRPGRSAHDAVKQARAYVRDGRRWVVDLDLEQFFDRVNHDILMARVARKVKDRRVLRLIRNYLQAGVMEAGIAVASMEGTPQGGPLSPLLSNIMLDDLDRELERRGHRFCRYADDCNVYVRSKHAGERVMDSLTWFLERKLRLKVNQAKSAVARPWERKFLGYSLTFHRIARLKVAPQSVQRFRLKLKGLFRAGRGRNLARFIREDLNPVLRGWARYFHLSEVRGTFEELDGWLRRRLRCMLWRQWKRVWPRFKRLRARGLDEVRAWKSVTNGRGSWWNSGSSHMNEAFPQRFFDHLGLLSLLTTVRQPL